MGRGSYSENVRLHLQLHAVVVGDGLGLTKLCPDGCPVRVVMADQHASDRLCECLSLRAGRLRRQVELLVRQVKQEARTVLRPLAKQRRGLDRRKVCVIWCRSISGRRDETFCPIVRRTIHWW